HQLPGIDLHDRDLEVAQRIIAALQLPLERRQHVAAIRAGKWTARRGRGRMCGEPQQALRGDEWTVDREYEADVMTRRAQSGDEARDGSAYVGAVVEDRKRERQRVGLLPDGDPLLAGRAQHAP